MIRIKHHGMVLARMAKVEHWSDLTLEYIVLFMSDGGTLTKNIYWKNDKKEHGKWRYYGNQWKNIGLEYAIDAFKKFGYFTEPKKKSKTRR